MEVSPKLLEVVRCPQCKGRLVVNPDRESLDCATCRLAYPVREGITLLLVDEALPIDP